MALLSTKLPWDLAQTKWSSILNPIISNPILAGDSLTDIILKANIPQSINHLLQRIPQGWFLIDNDSSATIWRAKPFTIYTITLESDADTTISIWIF